MVASLARTDTRRRKIVRIFVFAGISVLLHLLLILTVWLLAFPSVTPLKGGGGEVSVEIVSETEESGRLQTPSRKLSEARPTTAYSPGLAESAGGGEPAGGSPTAGSADEAGAGRFPGQGSGPLQGKDLLLAEIRARIERAKRYPLLARKFGVEGKTLVRFQINPEGRPEGIALKSTSGSKILDEEALATIKRAAPYPNYSDPLEIWIRFQLNP